MKYVDVELPVFLQLSTTVTAVSEFLYCGVLQIFNRNLFFHLWNILAANKGSLWAFSLLKNICENISLQRH